MYYTGRLSPGEYPPTICIEISLWDRFQGWGPDDTDKISFWKMKEIFTVLEQQRVSRDALENLGPPSDEKRMALLQSFEQQ